MKATAVAALVSVFAHADSSYEHFMQQARARASAPGPAPVVAGSPGGPGPAPMPEHVENAVKTKKHFENKMEEHFEEEMANGEYKKPTPVIMGWEVEFEIENYNYFDLNKALVIPASSNDDSEDDGKATKKDKKKTVKKMKLSKPPAETDKDPRLWSREAVEQGVDNTGVQASNLPKKLDGNRDGLYPVDLTNGANMASTRTEDADSARQETKVEAKAKVEEASTEKSGEEVTQGSESKSQGGISGGFAKTSEQFREFTTNGGPQHDTKGKLYPVDLAGFLQTKTKAAMRRCLTEEGMFEDTCVVDVLRDAVKSAFVDLVETVLDTPEERDELLKWFTERQADRHDEALEDEAETEDTPPVASSGQAEFMAIKQHAIKVDEMHSKLIARQQALAPAPAAAPVAAPVAGPGGAPGPAVPVVETAMQGKAGAPAGAPLGGGAPAPGGPPQFKADVYVQFYPGEERPVVEDGEVGRSTIVKVWIRGTPNTGVFELAPWIEGVLKRHEEDGLLEMLLEKRLFDATEIAPTISGIKDIRLESKSQWSLNTCETHMRKIMREFSMAYTRRMVPTAIYNECTNFVAEVSFSHDRIFDSHDRIKCRHATVKLAKEWNFGKGHTTEAPEIDAPAPAPASAPGPAVAGAPVAGAVMSPAAVAPSKPDIDFKGFCADVCEIKYGVDAPMCHVTEGKKLWSAPP